MTEGWGSRTESAPLVVLGVGGGIAAYKACEVVRRLRDCGYEVQVVPTEAGLRFVGRPTWESLSGRPAPSTCWEDISRRTHVDIGKAASAVLVAPATADLLARAAGGRADDLLTATLLITQAPQIFAPAMHSEMWEHAATQENVRVLRARGAKIAPPDIGQLAGGDYGEGRLPHPASLVALVQAAIERRGSETALAGRRIVISAGGTREPIDPVRYLGNRSSGRQGWCLAAAAAIRGADVALVAANVALPDIPGVETVRVETATQLRGAVVARAAGADAVVMAAAVADFHAGRPSDTKLKREVQPGSSTKLAIELERTADVLAELSSDRTARRSRRPVLVGFAAETVADVDELTARAAAKLRAKEVDLVVANRVGVNVGFDSEENEVVLVAAGGQSWRLPRMSKIAVANAVLDAVAIRLTADPTGT